MDIQTRLERLGYNQNSRLEALRLFKTEFNINGDLDTVLLRLQELSNRSPNLEMLARIIYSESKDEPYRGQVAVGAVVLNRIQSPAFPNTMREVIVQPLAFTVVEIGTFWLQPDRRAYRAAQEALRGSDPTNGCLYFFNPVKSTSSWIRRLKPVLRIGRHLFARNVL